MSKETTSINKQIAKNTVALYFRTFITMIVGIYTSRILMDALGIEDYGINAVVGGIIGMSTLITATMQQAISRYLTFSLGKGEIQKSKTIFSTAINAQILISVIAVFALEIVGVWFLNRQANIPDGRMYAANWLLQCSIVLFVFSLVGSPFSALIVAHEHMGVYAYTSVIDAVLKLSLCYILIAFDGDRLILYGELNVLISVCMFAFYSWYCKKRFQEAHYSIKLFDRSLLKELTVFSGWNLFSQVSWTLNTQGISMLINVFFGVLFNAAQGVAMVVNGCIEKFVSSFTVAFQPQIIKTYAAKEYDICYRLVNRGCRYSWMLMLLFVVPVYIEADELLSIWLVEVPEFASVFLRFILFYSISLKLSDPLHMLIQANGKIERYTIHTCILGIIVFPATWLLYKYGAPVWSTYIVSIVIRFLIPIFRLYHLHRLTTYPWRSFVHEVANPCILVLVISFAIPLTISLFWEDSLTRFVVLTPLSVFWTIICCIIFGLTKQERTFFIGKTKEKIAKISKR